MSVLISSLGHRVLNPLTPSGTSYGTYTTSTFAVAAGTHTIAFIGQAPTTGDCTAFLDAVSVAVAAQTVPTVGDSGFESVSAGSSFEAKEKNGDILNSRR